MYVGVHDFSGVVQVMRSMETNTISSIITARSAALIVSGDLNPPYWNSCAPGIEWRAFG